VTNNDVWRQLKYTSTKSPIYKILMSVHKYLASLVAYSVASSPVSNVTPHFAGEWKWFAARKKARTGLPACEVTSSFWKRDYAHLLLWAELHQLSYKEHNRRSRTPPSHIRGSSRGSENRKCTAKTVKTCIYRNQDVNLPRSSARQPQPSAGKSICRIAENRGLKRILGKVV